MSLSAPSPIQTVERTVRLLANPVSVRAAREVAEEAAVAFGFDEESSYEFKLAASEAVSNAIEHGLPCDDGCIGLHVVAECHGWLTLWVRDCGTFPPRRPDPVDMPERGRGLEMIAVLVDEVELLREQGETTIRMRKRRPA